MDRLDRHAVLNYHADTVQWPIDVGKALLTRMLTALCQQAP